MQRLGITHPRKFSCEWSFACQPRKFSHSKVLPYTVYDMVKKYSIVRIRSIYCMGIKFRRLNFYAITSNYMFMGPYFRGVLIFVVMFHNLVLLSTAYAHISLTLNLVRTIS